MATERAANGEIPVEALLAQLRRAAEQDGVEDVDAVVAEFATFVRAQAPRIAAQRAGRRSGVSWSSALLTAGALSVAAFGAVASGLVTNPFLPSTPSFASASDRDPSDGDASDDDGSLEDDVLPVPNVGEATSDGQNPSQSPTDTASDGATDVVAEPIPAIEFTETAPMAFTDPDALAVLAEQRSAGPTPPPSTTPVAPTTIAPDAPAADDPVAAATTSASTPTTAPADATGVTSDTAPTTIPTAVLDASTGPESLVTPTPENQQNQVNTDQGGAG